MHIHIYVPVFVCNSDEIHVIILLRALKILSYLPKGLYYSFNKLIVLASGDLLSAYFYSLLLSCLQKILISASIISIYLLVPYINRNAWNILLLGRIENVNSIATFLTQWKKLNKNSFQTHSKNFNLV